MFVHWSSIKANGFKALADGSDVEYEKGRSDRSGKPAALNVTGMAWPCLQTPLTAFKVLVKAYAMHVHYLMLCRYLPSDYNNDWLAIV